MLKSRIGETYTHWLESDMLEMAKELEEQGYKVKRYYDENSNNFKVEIIGYKE